jgi:hypothetical protein
MLAARESPYGAVGVVKKYRAIALHAKSNAMADKVCTAGQIYVSAAPSTLF